MATATMRVTISKSAVLRVVGPMADRAAYRAAQVLRSRAVRNINQLGRVNTGRMKNSIRVRAASTSVALSRAYRVESTAPYTKYQEFGTRAHGPRRAPFLVFRVRGHGPLIFARRVRGVTPGHFMLKAKQSITPADYT